MPDRRDRLRISLDILTHGNTRIGNLVRRLERMEATRLRRQEGITAEMSVVANQCVVSVLYFTYLKMFQPGRKWFLDVCKSISSPVL